MAIARKKEDKVKHYTYRLQDILSIFGSVLIILTVGVISLYSTHFFSDSMTSKIAESRIDVLTKISDEVTDICEEAEGVFNLYWYNAFVDIPETVQPFEATQELEIIEQFKMIDYLNQQAYQLSSVDYEYVITLKNGFSYSSKNEELSYEFTQYEQELWYLDLVENRDEMIWVSTYKDYHEDEYISSLVRPYLDESGNIIGMFLLNVPEDNIYNMYADLVENNEMYIVDDTGKIVSHTNKEMLGIPYYDMEVFNNMFENEVEDSDGVEDSAFQIISKNNEEFLFSKVSNGQQHWSCIEEIPLDFILRDVYDLTNRLWFVAIICIVIAIVFFRYISSRTTAPLKLLVHQLEKIGRDVNDDTKFDVKGWEEVNRICDECNFMNDRIKNLILEVQHSEQEKSKAELGFLQAQMSPHFMYNTLFSIKCLVDMDDKKGAIDTLNAFTAILKYILSYKSEYVTVAEEIVLLEEYTKLQKVLYGDKFVVSIHCEQELYDKQILRMILQPLVENSLQHGLRDEKERISVEVLFAIEGDGLQITILDDGIGFNRENLERLYKRVDKVDKQNKQSNLIGLNNIRQRIKKRYGKDYGVFIDATYEEGAKIVVKLPIDIQDIK